MERIFLCKFCNKNFSSKSNLITHITKAKYCILKRSNSTELSQNFESLSNKEIIQHDSIELSSSRFSKVIDHKCKYCSKSFTSKHFLLSHMSKCNDRVLQEQKTYFESRLQEQKTFFETNLHAQKTLFEIRLQEQKILSKNTIHEREKLLQQQKILFENTLHEREKLLQEQKILFENKLHEREKLLQEKDSVISIFKEQIAVLQDKLGFVALEGARKPTIQTNNANTTTNVTQILTPFNLSDDDILAIVQHKLDENSFLNSQKGVAKFCVENILKDEDGKMRMICTDPSRERFKYMDENGVVKEDIKARQFIQKLYPPLHLVSEKLYCNIVENCNKSREKIEKGEEKIDPYRIKVREEAADKAWIEIRLLKNEDSNKTFRKELSIGSNV